MGCATAATPASKDPTLNGQWDGILTINRSPSDQRNLALRLTLDDAEIKVAYLDSKGEWSDMPGLFRISRQGSNAVIQATNSNVIDGKGWYETWVFVVTFQSENKLRTEFVRMVNNVDLPASDTGKAFSYGGTGMLIRLKPTRPAQTGDANNSIIEITAEESGNYNWQGKSLSAEQLKSALFAEIKINPFSDVRLLKGNADLNMKRNLEFGLIVHAVGANAFVENDGKFVAMIFQIDD